ncbi:MAG: glycosyltransferase [Chloroflexi bacterium]|nr:glycosyltransferase [Chloroflexota bacterium]
MHISIILPTYNERGNIIDLIDAIESQVTPLVDSVQIVVVDDNSPDGTANLVRERAKQSGACIDLYVRTTESGLATAIKYGLQKCRGDVVVVMDTDFNHDPKMIPQMVDLLKYYDVIIGSRFVMGGGMEEELRYRFSFLYNLFVRIIIRTQVQDNLSGFFAMRRDKLMVLNLDYVFRGYGEYFIRLLYLAWRQNYKMIEVPVFYVLRRHGQSKSRFLNMLRDYTACVLDLRLGHWVPLDKRVVGPNANSVK